MTPLRFRIRTAGRAAALAGSLIARLGVAELDVLRHPGPDRAVVFDRHAKRWARAALSLMGARLIVEPGQPPAPDGPRLVVANHRTTLDVLVLLSLFGGHFLSRGDLAGWPLIGRAARSAGVVFVDRDDRKSGAAAIRRLRRLLREGRTVIVFPEGTTQRGDEVHPFHAGGFVAARGLDVEVVPVGLAYPEGTEWFGDTFGAHAAKLASRPRTEVRVCIGEARRSAGIRTEELARQLREAVQDLVPRARAIPSR
jgi:1-acyl-sn-glycerol-3-phosphate acyltransferase